MCCTWLADNTGHKTTTTVLWPFVRDYPGEPVSEKNTHPPTILIIIQSLSACYILPRSIASSLFKLRAWQSFCTIQDAKITQKIAICTPSAISMQIRHVSTIGKKLVKQLYLLHMSSQCGELQPTTGWDWLVSLGHPSKFQQLSCLGFITAPMSLNGAQPNFARCLPISWAGTLYKHFRGLLPPNGIYY